MFILFRFIDIVENLEHCDFIALRNMIIRTHLQDLKDVTNNVHYENYRCRKLAGLGADGKSARLSNKYVYLIFRFISSSFYATSGAHYALPLSRLAYETFSYSKCHA